ncbi:hypothetical protein [Candidatus Methanoperedens nitratireducens]|uniref:Uncharacterized protein n=1 Tax=Candidatus Methanoperedens nitratireducens TaxID=1392998 RepID=A0A284VMX6_9EURY|nr:hypothetical protein [Candidatus Methanoperedens nitroreducens]SNQ60547.1 exported hypothetical protein [Candidatus Methanoperedens nitroreducens]
MNKQKIFFALLLIPMLIAVWASASAENSAIPIPVPVNVQTEIFRISSNSGSEPIAPDQLKASVPIKGNATIYSSALVWGENIELFVDDKPFCNGVDSTVNCIIEQNPLVGGTSVIAVNFNTKLIPSGAHKFTVTTHPMPSPEGYSNTSDSIWILVN